MSILDIFHNLRFGETFRFRAKAPNDEEAYPEVRRRGVRGLQPKKGRCSQKVGL